MKFCIEVGTVEKHTIEFNLSQLLGELVIKVDSKPVKRARWLFNEPVDETYALQIGEKERVSVKILKKRKALFGNRCAVFLNERLMKVQEGI